MTRREFFAASTAAAAAAALTGTAEDSSPQRKPGMDNRLYELRIYTPHAGRTEALLTRFRDHTCALFARHGIENVVYWMPVDPADQRLHYIVRFTDQTAHDAAWKGFLADPEWQAAHKASEANGPLLAKPPESFLLRTTDYSPAVRTGEVSRGGVFELRTYTTGAGLLPNLDARFRDHTLELFRRHGMGSYAYWHRIPGQSAAETTLQYALWHQSKEAASASFAAFRRDPEWVAAKEASEKTAGGSLTVPDGVKSLFVAATDFSPTH